jgi:predicted AlkP superfamily pyrophosphatase or phosphodiesterase
VLSGVYFWPGCGTKISGVLPKKYAIWKSGVSSMERAQGTIGLCLFTTLFLHLSISPLLSTHILSLSLSLSLSGAASWLSESGDHLSLIMMYLDEVDNAGHKYGPGTAPVEDALKNVYISLSYSSYHVLFNYYSF